MDSPPPVTKEHPLVTYLRELADGGAVLDSHRLRAAANEIEQLRLCIGPQTYPERGFLSDFIDYYGEQPYDDDGWWSCGVCHETKPKSQQKEDFKHADDCLWVKAHQLG